MGCLFISFFFLGSAVLAEEIFIPTVYKLGVTASCIKTLGLSIFVRTHHEGVHTVIHGQFKY